MTGLYDPLTTDVPASVSMRQARLALLAAGLLDTIDVAISAQDRAVRISWEFAQEVRRDDPMLAEIAPVLGITQDGLDDLFRAAAQL